MRISDWSSDVCSSDLSQTRGSSASCPIFEHRLPGKRTGSRKKLKNRDRERRVMNNKAYLLASAVLMALPQVSNAQEAIAEEPDGGNDVIVVTAQRQAQSLQDVRSEEHTSELQSLMRISSAVFCWKKTK